MEDKKIKKPKAYFVSDARAKKHADRKAYFGAKRIMRKAAWRRVLNDNAGSWQCRPWDELRSTPRAK